MFTAAATPNKRSKSPSYNSAEKNKVVMYQPTPIKELKLDCAQFISTVKEYQVMEEITQVILSKMPNITTEITFEDSPQDRRDASRVSFHEN